MIDDENHPAFQAFRTLLDAKLQEMGEVLPFSRRSIEMMQEICDMTTATAHKNGVDFPDVVICHIKRLKLIRAYRRDADRKLIDDYIRNLIRERPEVTWDDVTLMIGKTFPMYVFSDWTYYKLNPKEIN